MKRTYLTIWLLGGLSSLAAFGCTSKDDILPEQAPALAKVSYAQTQCADRWGQAQGAPQLAAVATAYLAQQGITLHQPQASAQNPASVCNACTCPTGLVLTGAVRAADLPAVQALGFTQP